MILLRCSDLLLVRLTKDTIGILFAEASCRFSRLEHVDFLETLEGLQGRLSN